MEPATVLKYPGSKWSMTDWILDHLPPHEVYVEPFFGSGAVFFTKRPSRLETINDYDERVVNLFRVIRERPDDLAAAVVATPWSRSEVYGVLADVDAGDELERARRLLVWCWQQIGRRTNSPGSGGSWRWTKDATSNPVPAWKRLPERITTAAERLRDAQIECLPALAVIGKHSDPGVLLYCDPPYTPDTVGRALYRHTMSLEDHAELLDAIDAHPGPVLLSGYRCPLYDDRLTTWHRVERGAVAEGGLRRTEALWLNEIAARRLSQLVLPLGAG